MPDILGNRLDSPYSLPPQSQGRQGAPVIATQTPLQKGRNNAPFVEIMPLPTQSLMTRLDGANQVDIQIPDQAIYMRFSATDDFWVGFASKIGPPPIFGQVTALNGILNPAGIYFIQNLRGLTLYSSVVDTIVNVQIWTL